MKLAIFTSHPIQYQAPWFRALAKEPDLQLRVYFSHTPEAEEQGRGFGRAFHWDVALRDGYDSLVLRTRRLPPVVPEFARRMALSIDAELAQFSPDVALVMGWQELPLVQAFEACRRLRIPIILRGESNALRVRPLIISLVHRAYISRAAAALAIGDSNAEFYRAAGMAAERIAMARYCVDNEFFSSRVDSLRSARSSIRQAWNIAGDALCILFAGKLEAKKRVLDLIEAIKIVRERGSNIHLLIVGTGADQAQAERMAAEFHLPVTFAGFLNQSEMPRAYAAADALALLSDYGETWGLVVNEAMAAGLPAIVSERVGCAGDLALPNVTGAVVPFSSPAAVAEILVRWQDEPELVKRLGRYARQHVEQNYTVASAVRGLKQAASVALGREPGPNLSYDRTAT